MSEIDNSPPAGSKLLLGGEVHVEPFPELSLTSTWSNTDRNLDALLRYAAPDTTQSIPRHTQDDTNQAEKCNGSRVTVGHARYPAYATDSQMAAHDEAPAAGCLGNASKLPSLASGISITCAKKARDDVEIPWLRLGQDGEGACGPKGQDGTRLLEHVAAHAIA